MEIGTRPVILKLLKFMWVFREIKGCCPFLQLFDQMCTCLPLGYSMGVEVVRRFAILCAHFLHY